jgi:hypothetical protein
MSDPDDNMAGGDPNGEPRPGTKAALEVERDALQAKVEQLQGELASARAGGGSPALVTLAAPDPNFLSEGDRQAMEINGVVNSAVTGRELLASDFGITVKTEEGRRNLERAQARTPQERAGIRGVDFVYPSVAPGVLAADAPVRGAQPASAVEPAAPVAGADDTQV